MTLVTFTKDVHVVDNEAGVDRYFNYDDTLDVSKDELKLVNAYAKKNKLDDVYVDGAKDVRDNYVAPRPDSPSNEKAKKTGDK